MWLSQPSLLGRLLKLITACRWWTQSKHQLLTHYQQSLTMVAFRSTPVALLALSKSVKSFNAPSTSLHRVATPLFSTTADETTTTSKKISKSPMFEYLKFDSKPTFDVIAETKFEGISNRTRSERWRATHSADLDAYANVFPAVGIEMEVPMSVFSVVWTPEGKIIYEQVGAVVDRIEGNTEENAAVFRLLHTAGLKLNANPGDVVFRMIQCLGHLLGGRGRS